MKCTWCEDEIRGQAIWAFSGRFGFCDETCMDLWTRRRDQPTVPEKLPEKERPKYDGLQGRNRTQVEKMDDLEKDRE